MYTYYDIPDMIDNAEKYSAHQHRKDVMIYVDHDPDFCSPQMAIDPADTKGIEIFRRFAKKMTEHYKSLNQKP